MDPLGCVRSAPLPAADAASVSTDRDSGCEALNAALRCMLLLPAADAANKTDGEYLAQARAAAAPQLRSTWPWRSRADPLPNSQHRSARHRSILTSS